MASTDTAPLLGPLLREVLDAQRTAERLVGSYAHLRDSAEALAQHCELLSSPLVWPVGDPAERLAGAAVVVSEGRVRVRGWTDHLLGERVLLVAVVATTPLALLHAAQHSRRLGVAEVHACG